MKGIDVSSYQGTIDWKKVKESGVKFAILRCTTQKGIDTKFEYNVYQAINAGLEIGAYCCVYNEITVIRFFETIKKWNNTGVFFEKGLYLDLEVSSIDDRNKIINALKIADRYNLKYGIYVNKSWYKKYHTLFDDKNIWLASYSEYDASNYNNLIMVQTTSKGRVNGIIGNVDIDDYLIEEIEKPITSIPNNCPYLEPERTFDITNATPFETLWLKWYLSKHGYDIPVHSVYGEMTDLKLREFQKDNNIPEEEWGGVTELTRKKLKEFKED